MARFLNTAALTVMAAIVAAYEAGLLGANNAFFAAVMLGTIVVGAQLVRHEGEDLPTAARAIVANPAAHASAASYLSFIGVMVLSTALALQVAVGL